MNRPHNHQRVVSMHKMLFEMARGNFNNQIPLSNHDDEIETLVLLINMVAEELKESVFHSGFVNPHSTHKMVTSASFILDENYCIQNVNRAALDILGYDAAEMLKRPIRNFLKNELGDMSDQQSKATEERLLLGEIITLHFITSKMLMVSGECSISRLSEGRSTVLSFVAPYFQVVESTAESFDGKLNRHPSFRKTDARLMQRVYDYILANLAGPLPSIKELARKFGTNDCKLKDGFKYFFHTTIYQFYTDERLKRAYIMIEQTDMPLKNISFMNGFNNYPNFSKSFKKRFGFSPKELGRGETANLFISG
jgi:PAS domain S-box-containing protein